MIAAARYLRGNSLLEAHVCSLRCCFFSFQSLVSQSAGRIAILAGGGVTASNVSSFVSSTGVREVHASLRSFRWGRSLLSARKAGVFMGGEKVNKGLEIEYGMRMAEEDTIRQVATMLRQGGQAAEASSSSF